MTPTDKPILVSVKVLCETLGLSEARVGQLVRDGAVVREGRGSYDLLKSVAGYLAFLRKGTSDDLPTLKAQLLHEQIQKAKRENAIGEGETIPMAEITDFLKAWALQLDLLLTVTLEQDLPPRLIGQPIAETRLVMRDAHDRIREATRSGLLSWKPESTVSTAESTEQ